MPRKPRAPAPSTSIADDSPGAAPGEAPSGTPIGVPIDAAEVPPRPRLALCVCGGGATGAAWEIGALAGLEAAIPGFRVRDFDILIGSSAGALVASLLATGVSPTRLFHSLTSGDGYFDVRRTDVFRVDARAAAIKFGYISRAAFGLIRKLYRSPLRTLSRADIEGFTATLPDGMFSLAGYTRFIDRFLREHGLPRSFEQVERHLMIPVNNLDTAHREVFGRGYRLDATIPEAIAASSAIPIFFTPVRINGSDFIDGGTGKVAHVDLAVRAGATHVLVLNPIVPWNLQRRLAERRRRSGGRGDDSLVRIRERGMYGIWNQGFRISTMVKLHQGLRRFRAERPGVAIALLQPSETDETLFVTNPMNTDARSRIAQHAWDTTVRALQEGDEAIRAVCLGAVGAASLDGLRRAPLGGDGSGDP